MEAEAALGRKGFGAGWIFSVGWVDESRFREMLCEDRSGAEIFAADDRGNRYIFYHPTDVRYMRKDNETMKRDQDRWRALNEWAWKTVRRDFILDNLDRGLKPETYDSSTAALYLAQIAYKTGTKYTVSAKRFGTLETKNFDPAPYVDFLIRNAKYDVTKESETPNGDYLVISLPDQNARIDFFTTTTGKSYVREVHDNGIKILYKVTLSDGTTQAGDVAEHWYAALAAAGGK